MYVLEVQWQQRGQANTTVYLDAFLHDNVVEVVDTTGVCALANCNSVLGSVTDGHRCLDKPRG